MTWLDKLERRYKNYALEGLIGYVCMLMLLVFVLNQTQMLSYNTLYLNRDGILRGQIWRLFTFLLIPQSKSFFWLIFELLILHMCAKGLEAVWGSFKLTVYYGFGAAANIIAAFIVPEVQFGSYFLYISLFLGFATVYPDYEILFFFILPLKIKYIGMLTGGFMLLQLVLSPLPIKLAIVLSAANYLVFFLPDAIKQFKRQRIQKARSSAFEESMKQQAPYRHKCAVCGKTELDSEDLQFRYCTCPICGQNGVEFCLEHLKEHKENRKKADSANTAK